MIPVISKASGHTFSKTIERSGLLVVPDSADIIFYSGTTEVLEVYADIGDDGKVTFALTPDDVSGWSVGKYRAVWTITDEAGNIYSFTDVFRLAEVSFSEFEITTDEIYREAPYLADVVDALPGVVSAGSTKESIVSTMREVKGFQIVGSDLVFRSGDLLDVSVSVKAFADGVLSVSPALSEAPAVGDRFYLRRPISDQILAGLDQVRADLNARGITEDQIVDLEQVRGIVRAAIISLLCFNRIRAKDDLWQYRYDAMSKVYSDRMDRFKGLIDTNGDGDPETEATLTQVRARI